MRIAVDALLYGPQSAGVGQYISHLFQAYAARFPDDALLLALPTSQTLEGRGVQVFHPLQARRAEGAGGALGSRRRLLYEHLRLGRDFRQLGYDAAHFPDYQMPWRGLPRSVITIHDLAAFLYPETFGRQAAWVKRTLMRRSVGQAARIIVPSQATARDLEDCLAVDPARVNVVPHGVEAPDDFGPRPHDRPYWFFVGTLEPRKNLARLIRAYQTVRARYADAPDLVIAGKPGWLYEPIYQEAARVGQDRPVLFLGYVPRADVWTWYRHAVACCYPSLYEGFGLPVLEAMAAGCPVITAHRGAVAEVAEGLATLVDPMDDEAIAEALIASWRDPAPLGPWREAARQTAGRYTWTRTAEATRAVYAAVTETA